MAGCSIGRVNEEVGLLELFTSSAWAQTANGPSAAPAGPASFLVSFFPFLLIFALFYFLLIMPQQKRAKKRKSMIDNLKKGDRVTTTGGMFGTVTNLSPEVITLQVAEGVRIKVIRTYIEEVKADDAETAESK